MSSTATSDLPIDQIVDILRAHHITRASLFGSFARGAQTEQSDVDILVEFAEGQSLLTLADVELSLSDLLRRPVEVVTFRSLDHRIRANVLKEQVPIL